ncbi:hypothetical protein Salat_1151900 [Sesamum alatum]|uniref:Uncharacterized protein n=1 Tax=Sesamum alatum TaxID=300844 RepID=A0AAE2CNC5_9LAMI|nr:hypothetical protein Salat_1151900 [Sesamum alatum]
MGRSPIRRGVGIFEFQQKSQAPQVEEQGSGPAGEHPAPPVAGIGEMTKHERGTNMRRTCVEGTKHGLHGESWGEEDFNKKLAPSQIHLHDESPPTPSPQIAYDGSLEGSLDSGSEASNSGGVQRGGVSSKMSSPEFESW